MGVKKIATRILLALLFAAFLIGGLSRISFSVDVLKLLPARLGTATGLSLFARHFSRSTELIVTVKAPDAAVADDAVKVLAASFRAAPNLAERVVTGSPWEEHPEQLSELVAFLLLNQSTENFRAMIDRVAPENVQQTLRETKETLAESFTATEVGMASYDPLGLLRGLDVSRFTAASAMSEFSSADGTFRVIYVDAAMPMDNYRAAMSWMKKIRACVAAAKLSPDVKVGFTGEPAYVAEISGQMQKDMAGSGFLTTIIISVIFFLCFRRVRPLMDLIAMLGTTFVVTLATAGWVLSQLNMIGVGFASIMIGLSVDYGYMVYQSSLKRPGRAELRRQVLPYVLWAATTTSAAFFTLNASSMPGLNHLGNLVGIGVIVGGAIMLSIFIPLVTKRQPAQPEEPSFEKWLARPATRSAGFFLTLALVALLIGALLVKGWPALDTSVRSLKMRHSDADDVLEELYSQLTDDRSLMSCLVVGRDEADLLARLRALDGRLREAEANGFIKQSFTPLVLCPDEAAQRANLAAAATLFQQRDRIFNAAMAAGFQDDALGLTKQIFEKWESWKQSARFPIWPQNEASVWILRRLIGKDPQGFVAMGLLEPTPGAEEKLISLQDENVHLVSWPLLGRELRRVIPREFVVIIVSLLAGLFLLLAIAFRSARDLLLMALTMAVVFLAMMGAMRLIGMEWNVFNLAAVMLLLGTGTDYSIYMILALNRNGGDVALTQRSTGLVVFLCSGSAVAGFGTLAWAGHRGLASLGQVCALGLAIDALVAVFLLPNLWICWRSRQRKSAGILPREA